MNVLLSGALLQGDCKSPFRPLLQIICLGYCVKKQPGSYGAIIQSWDHLPSEGIKKIVKAERFSALRLSINLQLLKRTI